MILELLAVSSFHVCGPKIQHLSKEVPASDSPESVGFEEKALSCLQRGGLGVSISNLLVINELLESSYSFWPGNIEILVCSRALWVYGVDGSLLGVG